MDPLAAALRGFDGIGKNLVLNEIGSTKSKNPTNDNAQTRQIPLVGGIVSKRLLGNGSL